MHSIPQSEWFIYIRKLCSRKVQKNFVWAKYFAMNHAHRRKAMNELRQKMIEDIQLRFTWE